MATGHFNPLQRFPARDLSPPWLETVIGLSPGQRRLAAIMFTDMVGYTALGQRNEALSLALLEEHRKLIRPIIIRHNGREVKTMGDAFLVEFPNALDAVRCAYDIQRAIREFNFSLAIEKRIQLRIGVHVGEVVESLGDISGDAVNVASRIEALSESGGVCLTRQVHDHIRNKFELPLRNLGTKLLKNVDLPVEVYRIVMPWEEVKEIPEPLDPRRIAVLPFVNISPDPEDEYLADGMTEELITSLSGVRELTVVGRTSVVRYKNTERSLSEIGSELKAGNLVEGSVRKSSDRLRISVQLIDSKSEGHVWAQNYDRRLEDIFAIQEEIAKSVTRELKIRLVESERRRIERRPTESTEAYTLYLKGRHFWNERNEESVNKAVEYFNKSLVLDSGFALGYSGLADCYLVMGFNGLAEPLPSFERAKEFSAKALEFDPNLGEAHVVLAAAIHNLEFEFEKSEPEMKRGIELNPNYPTGHQWYSQFLWFRGRFQEAEMEIRKALELDPFSLVINVNLGDLLYFQGKFDSAIEQLRKVIQLEPTFIASHTSLINAYVRKGMYEDALREADTVKELANWPAGGELGRAYVYATWGKATKAETLLKEVEGSYRSENLSPSLIAAVHFLLGHKERGFEWLDRAYKERDSQVNNLAIEFDFEGIRNDPRYLELVDKLHLPRPDGFGRSR